MLHLAGCIGMITVMVTLTESGSALSVNGWVSLKASLNALWRKGKPTVSLVIKSVWTTSISAEKLKSALPSWVVRKLILTNCVCNANRVPVNNVNKSADQRPSILARVCFNK